MKIEMMEFLSDKIDDIDLLKDVIETLDNMSSDDRMKTFNELKKYRYNKFVCSIAVDSDVLSERTIEDRIKLMEELKKCDYNDNAYKLATDINVLRKRTNEEQIKLKKMAHTKSKQQKLINHSYNMEEISDVTEFKMYLNELKQELGKDTDVKSDTVVLKFSPDKKNERKEN